VRESIVKSEPAGSQDAVSLLALFLYAQAGEESVRTREALAATIANQVKGLLSERAASMPNSLGSCSLRAGLFVECLDRLGSTEATPPPTDEPTFASCWRIAKRAISGALQDPTGGAARFHELGSSPAWAAGLTPSAWIGSYLFYSDEEGRKLPPGTELAADPHAYRKRVRGLLGR
jgi:N-acetylmuramoyl-L-alanine amidase